MEAAKTRRAARMLELQRSFQSVVKQELQRLLTGGTKREAAVKLLLRRIVASTETPEAAAVRGVMRQFQMNHDDAVRALIVKQELGRLKRQGLDSFAAIEELTRKMRSREVEQEVEHEVEQVEHQEISVQEKLQESVSEQETGQENKKSELPAAETSLSLCQRIGNVSISSGNTSEKVEESEDTDGEENESAGEKNKAGFKSPLRVRSPTNSSIADLTPQSRKRRAAFGVQFDSGNSRSTGGRSVKPLFPSLKKQKLCAEVGDGFLQVVTRKSKPTSSVLSKSTSGTSSGSAGGGSTRSDVVTKNLHKRQRASSTGMQDDDESPIAEEVRVHHRHHHHHSKRQKNGLNAVARVPE